MRSLAASALLLLAAFAAADYQPTEWQWKGWTIQTGEDLSLGSTHTSYPVTNMFDGNPSTAWVYSGLGEKARKEKLGITDYESSSYAEPFWITLKPSGKLTLDGLRLMNGYNKSEKSFRDNRRVLVLEIWAGGYYRWPGEKPLKTVRLKDEMGWHDISLPRRRYTEGITLRLKQLSGARTEDVALSELQLLKDGKPIDLTPAQANIFTAGSDCGCGTEYEIRSASNTKIIDSVGGESGGGPALSADGRYIGGFATQDEKRATAWIVDTRDGRVVKRRTVANPNEFIDVVWKRGVMAVFGGEKVLAKLKP